MQGLPIDDDVTTAALPVADECIGDEGVVFGEQLALLDEEPAEAELDDSRWYDVDDAAPLSLPDRRSEMGGSVRLAG